MHDTNCMEHAQTFLGILVATEFQYCGAVSCTKFQLDKGWWSVKNSIWQKINQIEIFKKLPYRQICQKLAL